MFPQRRSSRLSSKVVSACSKPSSFPSSCPLLMATDLYDYQHCCKTGFSATKVGSFLIDVVRANRCQALPILAPTNKLTAILKTQRHQPKGSQCTSQSSKKTSTSSAATNSSRSPPSASSAASTTPRRPIPTATPPATPSPNCAPPTTT